MFVQAAVALLIPVYYFVMVTYRLRSNVPLFLAIVLLLVIGRLKKRTEAADEYAKQTLRIADSICFRLAVVLMGVILLPLLFKEYREKRGMKQSELAALVGVRRETIVHLENGRYNPSLKLAMDIAKVFHTTVEELFAFTD